MNNNGKLQEDSRICSPVQQPVQPMVVNNYYGPAVMPPLDLEPEEVESSGGLLWVLGIIAVVAWMLWGWDLFK